MERIYLEDYIPSAACYVDKNINVGQLNIKPLTAAGHYYPHHRFQEV
jgi:hypothetical protein